MALSILALFSLCWFAYFPFLELPFISDDYVQIQLARDFISPQGLKNLIADPLYRCRATSLFLTKAVDSGFGMNPYAHNVLCLLMHALNTLLVAAFGRFPAIGWRLALFAAGFFAIHEGHQEAVVWMASLPELLVFFFSLLTLHAWLEWLETKSPKAYGVSVLLFVLGLLSKESAVAITGCLALAGWWKLREIRPLLLPLLPLATISAIYAGAIALSRSNHLHLNDGTFSLSAPFWITLPVSIMRLSWIWGVVACVVIALLRPKHWLAVVSLVFAWMTITLAPYSFLTYMNRVPSRHTYLASAGLAFLVAFALYSVWPQLARRRVMLTLTLAVLIAHNVLYLWVKKLPQYMDRAMVTERLIQFAAMDDAPIRLRCFPYGVEVAERAVQQRIGKPIPILTGGVNSSDKFRDYCDPWR